LALRVPEVDVSMVSFSAETAQNRIFLEVRGLAVFTDSRRTRGSCPFRI